MEVKTNLGGVLLLYILIQTIVADTNFGKVDKDVLDKLSETPTADIIISMKRGTAEVLQQFKEQDSEDITYSFQERVTSVSSALELNAQETQKDVLDFLTKRSKDDFRIRFESLWISNQIFVQNSNLQLISALADLDDIARISLNREIELNQPSQPITVNREEGDIAWGVHSVGATKVWELGNRGQGIRVGIIDTGVRWTHEALKDNYVGEYGWYDPYSNTLVPDDYSGHGSHVAGTILGKRGIGVAPNATWMTCRGCEATCTLYALTKCGEFMLRPTLPDGSKPDPAKAAHIVNNSWSGGQGQNFYKEVVDAWHAAGIIPVFAIGNNGSAGCGTAQSPGDMPNVIGVGATNITNTLAWFSNRGPSINGLLKPDICGPGFDITSSWNNSDTGYAIASGTSMGCPHVSGVIALLKSDNPKLTFTQIKSLIFRGADTNVQHIGENCGKVDETTFPNNMYGHGRISAINSIQLSNGNIHAPGFMLLALSSTLVAKYM